MIGRRDQLGTFAVYFDPDNSSTNGEAHRVVSFLYVDQLDLCQRSITQRNIRRLADRQIDNSNQRINGSGNLRGSASYCC